MVAHLAMSGVFSADKGSRKARKHRERMRSFVMACSQGAGYQFMDEATYMQRCQSLEFKHTPDDLRDFVPMHMWGDGAPNRLVHI